MGKSNIGFRIWLQYQEKVFLAPGKAELLEQLDKTGSLKKAAESMGMSYRKAWYSIQQVNANAPKPVVSISRGGAHGGSSHLTDYGRKLVDFFKEVCSDCNDFLAEQLKKMPS